MDLVPGDSWRDAVASSLAPLPAQRRETLAARLSDPTAAQLDAVVVVVDLGFDGFVSAALDAGVGVALALARAANELAKDPDRARKLATSSFVSVLALEEGGQLSSTQAKAVLAELLETGGDPAAIVRAKGFEQLSDDAVEEVVAAAINDHPNEWARYAAGDDKLAQFFVGEVMKRSRGRANGKAVIAELASRR